MTEVVTEHEEAGATHGQQRARWRQGQTPLVCDLRACHLCTPCAHGNGMECRQTVRCPATGQVNACRGAA